MIGLIRAHDLDRWGARVVSPPEFPRLVRRLVHATGRSLLTVDFPADEAIRLAGFDGKVLSNEGTPYVPVGFSVWELGTNQDPKRKADEDYEKRTNDPRGIEKEQTTFVFVTPRNWPGKNEWAASRRAEGEWKDVLALDAENLAQWLESAAGVAAWFGPVIGVVPEDVRALEAECEAYASATRIAFELSGLLIGREEQASKLIEFLRSSPTAIEVSATTTAEGVAFVGACIQTLDEELSESIMSRAVWVDSNAGLRHLAASNRPLIVIASDDLQNTSILHHRVVVRTTRASRSSSIDLGVQPISEIVEYLAKLGMDRNDAYRRCRDAGGNLERVRHSMLLVEPPAPAWASSTTSVAVAASILIGGWDENNEADRAVVSALAGVDYEEFLRAVVPYQHGPSPLISHAGTVWKVYARPATWQHLEPSLTSRQLRAFLDASLSVLLEDDPRFELRPAERWMANVHDKRRAHSPHLRSGLVDGLVHMAVLGRSDSACYAGQRPQSWIDKVCRDIFDRRRETNFWRRIRRDLKQLAEASPDQFLSALEADLSEAEPQVCELFEDEGDFGGCLHADLLWALELLAWSPEYIGRAAMVLASLAEGDPGGRYANRPASSLVEVMLPADPQCSLSASDRLKLLDMLMLRRPRIGWKLGAALMPTHSIVSSPTARPELREWGKGPRKPVFLADYWAEIQQISERLFQAAGADLERWEFLLSHLKAMQPTLVAKVLNAAEGIVDSLSTEQRASMWSLLRNLLHRHNQFSSEEPPDWVYERAVLDQLESLYESLTPVDPIARSSWLFSFDVVRPTNTALDWEENQRLVDADRATAIDEFIKLGLDTLIAELGQFRSHRLLGYHLGRSTHATSIEQPLLKRCTNSVDSSEQEFAKGFAAARYEFDAGEFMRRWCDKSSPEFLSWRGTALVAQAFPASEEVWDVVDAVGTECQEEYWKNAPIYLVNRPPEAERAAKSLVSAGRALDAISLLAANVNGAWLANNGDLQLVIDVLKACVLEANDRSELDQRRSYDIVQIFQAITESGRVQSKELIQLEWMYFGVLEHHAQHKLALYENLIFDPSLLLQLVALVYLPEGEQELDRPEPSQSEKAMASQAWRVLHHWQPFGTLSPQAMPRSEDLATTIRNIRSLAGEHRQQRVMDDLLGRALASSPMGIDECWPHESVRDALESYGGIPELAEGFVVGKGNLRGVTARLPSDGGRQELDLAQCYGDWQRALAVSHPLTSKLLGELAENLRSHAHWEDVQVITR